MISSMLVGGLRRRDIHYGWVVVGVTFLTMLVTAGALGAPGILMVPLEKEFGWDTAEISSAMALRFVLFGLMAPFAAVFLNRLGVRRMAIIALGTIIFGLAVSLFMREVWPGLKAGVTLAEVGFLLILFAGVWLVAAQIPAFKMPTARTIVAGIALAVAGVLLIIATHWGHFG